MKLNKIAAIALAAVAMTACSDDDSKDLNNVAGVTVNMEKATLTTRENAKIFNVPVAVTGETNGKVIVTVETTPTAGANEAVADVNYIVTSYSVIIPAGATTGNIEICAVDNEDENDARFFDVTLTNVEGAALGTQTTTVVELRDNDTDPYDKLAGKWVMECTSVFNGGDDGPFDLDMETPDPVEEAEYYGNEVYGFGVDGYNFAYVTFNYGYNEITEQITMSIQTGSYASSSILNFTQFKGVFVGASAYNQTGDPGDDIPLVVTTNEKGFVTSLEPVSASAMYFLQVFDYPDMNFIGYYDGWGGMYFEKK